MKKKFFAILLLCCLLFTGCAPTPVVPDLPPENPSENPPEQPSEPELEQLEYPLVGEWYTLHKINDAVYLEVTESSFLRENYDLHVWQPIVFSSVAEMYERISTFQLTEKEMVIIANQFKRNDTGMIPVFDLNKLPVMRLPDGYYLEENVEWYGNYCYQYAAHPNLSKADIRFCCYVNKSYDSIAEARQELLSEEKYIVTTLKDRNAMSYLNKSGSHRYITYTLTQNNKEIYVQEYYFLRPNEFLKDVSATIPRTNVYGTENNLYFDVVFPKEGGFGSYPPLDIISALGVELFVPGTEYKYGYDFARHQITYPIEHEWYTLRKMEDAVYLEVSDDFVVNDVDKSSIMFSSLNEMHTRIVKGQLTKEEINIIADGFSKDETGMIPIIDLNALPSPKYPSGYQSFVVNWGGKTLNFVAHDPINAERPMLVFRYEWGNDLKKKWEELQNSLEEGYLSSHVKTKTKLKDRNATEYLTAQVRYIVYTWKIREKTLFGYEVYTEGDLTVPRTMCVIVTENGTTLEIDIEDSELFNGYPPEHFIEALGAEIFMPESETGDAA
ncbi:MAG: hypothetical protein IJY20_08970 [Clostridia bacterium]|nr:hypothetical protein [Clostridia bacterium]